MNCIEYYALRTIADLISSNEWDRTALPKIFCSRLVEKVAAIYVSLSSECLQCSR